MEVKTVKPLASLEPIDLVSEDDRYIKKSNDRGLKRVRGPMSILFWLGVCLLKLALVVAIAFVCWQGFSYALHSDRFSLSEIKFYGTKHLNTKALEATIKKEFPQNLMRIDLRKIQEMIETDSWVLKAEVRRQLPNALQIDVVERVPQALALVAGELFVIDKEGTLLEKYQPKFGRFDLPIVKGLWTSDKKNYLETNQKRAKLFFNLIEALDGHTKNYSKNISEVDVSNAEDAVVLLMNDTTPVHFGDRNFLKRYQTFMANLSEYQSLKAKHQNIESVDLRFENQIVCRTIKQP